MQTDDDTIAAIATPIGQAGIGIIRISGPQSFEIAGRIFRSKNPTDDFKSHRLTLGHLYDPGSEEIIDEVLLSLMRAPHSYTREDVVEINSHSGYLLLSKILQIVLDQGARLAKPGEFTLRAFLNGRVDLTQAEAVIDLINAKSEKGLQLASQQIRGTFKREIETLQQETINLIAHAEVAIDFPDEDVPTLSSQEATKRIKGRLVEPIEALIKRHARKTLWVDGINTVIAGRVNVGKSSLLNRLLDEPRAIVTPIPGTTRDIIESFITIKGLPLRLMDTAGFGTTKDEVERIGLRLTEEKLSESDFLLVVIDQSRPLNQDDFNIIAQAGAKKALVVFNKIDLPCGIDLEPGHHPFTDFPFVRISALTGEGLEELREAIMTCLLDGDMEMTSSNIGPKLRHRQALMDALQFFKNAQKRTEEGAPMEIIALELKSGLDALGEIIGETTSEAVLDAIFSQFCIGK